MIKLQLTSDAIESILKGDDGTIKLELQNSVVQEFAKRHLKGVIDKVYLDTVVKDMIAQLRHNVSGEVSKALGSLVSTNNWGARSYQLDSKTKEYLSEKIKDNMDTCILSILDKSIEDYITDYLKRIDIEARIQAKIDNKIQYEIEKRVKDRIQSLIK